MFTVLPILHRSPAQRWQMVPVEFERQTVHGIELRWFGQSYNPSYQNKTGLVPKMLGDLEYHVLGGKCYHTVSI